MSSTSGRPFFLQYDVPTRNGRPVCANPSNELWEAGCIRITYSCWLVMESDIPYPLLARLDAFGVRTYTIPFDVSATDSLKALALANIRREIDEHLIRARETRNEAETQLADETDTQFARRRQRYLSAARSIEKRVTEMLARVSVAAERFGITGELFGRTGALASVELIAANMRERAAAFASAHGILTRCVGRNHAMTRGLRNGSVPAVVVADFLNDLETGETASAGDRLRSSFGY